MAMLFKGCCAGEITPPIDPPKGDDGDGDGKKQENPED